MKQSKSTGDIGVDYALGQLKAIQKCMHLDAEMAYRSLPKQETLEEVAETMYPNKTTKGWIDQYSAIQRIHFIEGAKWQQERMYSEEDMIKAIKFGSDGMYGWQLGEEGYTVNQIERFLKTLK